MMSNPIKIKASMSGCTFNFKSNGNKFKLRKLLEYEKSNFVRGVEWKWNKVETKFI